jgi:threonine dehydratase
MKTLPTLEGIREARNQLKGVCKQTPFVKSERLSQQVNASVFLKREDLQEIRSFKIRGAYTKMNALTSAERKQGVLCASAGNHAQGVAYTCKALKIQGQVYMPATTPQQKVAQVQYFGGDYVNTLLVGDTYDECQQVAFEAAKKEKKIFIHAFDDLQVIEGQATIALELLEQYPEGLDTLLVPIGGGGLIAGLLTVFKSLSPQTEIIGVEPMGASSMKLALDNGQRIPLQTMDRFVDGAAVREVGALPFSICSSHLQTILTVDEGKICQTLLDLYNKDGIVAEPAGALAISALDQLGKSYEKKTIGVMLCGGNNDILRMQEIRERALIYANLKHYFLVQFPQRSGALKEFVTHILGSTDDITHFEFSKKNYRNSAPAVVGIELKQASDFDLLVKRMKKHKFKFQYLNDKPDLFQFLV